MDDVCQEQTQYCKAIILIKNKYFFKKKKTISAEKMNLKTN